MAFADPPYATDIGAGLVAAWLERPFAARVRRSSTRLPCGMPSPGKTRRYGTTSLTFYHSDDS